MKRLFFVFYGHFGVFLKAFFDLYNIRNYDYLAVVARLLSPFAPLGCLMLAHFFFRCWITGFIASILAELNGVGAAGEELTEDESVALLSSNS